MAPVELATLKNLVACAALLLASCGGDPVADPGEFDSDGATALDGSVSFDDASTGDDASVVPVSDASVVPVSDAGCPRQSVACNGSCLGVGQTAGSCQALRVEEQISALALADSKLYVSQALGTFELDLKSQAYRKLGDRKIDGTNSLAVDAQKLALAGGGSIRRYDIDADQVTVLADGLKTAPTDLRIVAGYVFYDAGSLFRVPLAGGMSETLVGTGTLSGASGYVVDGDTLYVLSSGGLRTRSLSGGAASETVLAMNFQGEQLFADDTHLYTNDAGTLRRVPKAGGSVEVAGQVRSTVGALAVSGSDVFFAVTGPQGSITRVTLGKSAKVTTVYEGGWPMAAATGGGYLYVGLAPTVRGTGVVRITLSP